MTLARVDDSGLHFDEGLRYGHATWVDARGARTAVRARFEAGHILFEVPAQVLEASAYPAVLDPLLTAELAVDAPVQGVSIGGQGDVAIGLGTSSMLVVWTDGRDPAGTDLYGYEANLPGLDSVTRFAVATGHSNPYQPFVFGHAPGHRGLGRR